MNQINLIGRLTSDLEVRTTNGGTTVGKFTVAVNRDYKEKDGNRKTDFINCVVFGKSCEVINQYSGKGLRIHVSGRLQIEKFQAKDGTNRYSHDVMVDSFEFLDFKDSGNNNQNQNNNNNNNNNNQNNQGNYNNNQPNNNYQNNNNNNYRR